MRDPIVVTGMGVVSPLGCSVEGMWRRLIASESGLRRLPDDIVPDIDAKVAGIVPSKGEHPDGFGFGGVNASIVIKRVPQRETDASVPEG